MNKLLVVKSERSTAESVATQADNLFIIKLYNAIAIQPLKFFGGM